MTTARIAMHVHSEWSFDATWPLPRIAAEFARRRYRVVLLADHDRGFDPSRWDEYRDGCRAASTDQVLLIPGTEYADAANVVHVPTWGLPTMLGEGLPTAAVLDAVEAADAVAVLAHPVRRDAWRTIDPAWLPRFTGIEMWNRKYDGVAPSAPGRDLLRSASDALPVVSLDFHTSRQFFPLAMELDLSGAVTEESVLESLRNRHSRSMAAGLPATAFGRGVPGVMTQFAERARRPVARRARALLRS
jgi:hypothetical protein